MKGPKRFKQQQPTKNGASWKDRFRLFIGSRANSFLTCIFIGSVFVLCALGAELCYSYENGWLVDGAVSAKV